MYKGYKFRIYPTEAQKVLIEKHIGCNRFVYNLALQAKLMAYSGTKTIVSNYELQKQLTELKKQHDWLYEVSANSLNKSLDHLDKAFKAFYKGTGKYPKFKKKSNGGRYQIREDVNIKADLLFIEKFREGIKIIQHRRFSGDIKNATISKTPTGKYFASILVLNDEINAIKNNNILNSVGVDLGIKTFAVLSNGYEYTSPAFLRKSLSKLKILSRIASKKKRGSANRKKANIKVALMHEKVANQRANFLHNVSHEITNRYDTICMEDLATKNMVQNHNLALSISDSGWGNFSEMIKYKSGWRGKTLITVDRYFPSSKMCSKCGTVKDMPLSERVYNCVCGLSIDRDINAAINIRNSGILRAGGSVEQSGIFDAMKQKKRRLKYNQWKNH